MTRAASLFAALLALAPLFAPLFALAQAYPSKPVKLLTGFAAGGAADTVARLMAQKMSEGLGQQVVVENRTGAAGLLANEFIVKSPADGYTLLLVSGAYPVQAAMLRKLPYDPLRDFAMVSMLIQYPFVLIVNASSQVKTPAEFVAFARANPNKLNYGSSGIGSVHHLSSELFNALAGTDISHLPFRGGNAQITELIAGRLDVVFEALPNVLPFIKGGKIRAIAVSSPAPSSFLPDVPPLAQALPGYEVSSFFGLGVRTGTPAALIAQLNTEARRALAQPDLRQKFLDLGGEARASEPEEMHRFIEQEVAKWKRVVETRKIELQ